MAKAWNPEKFALYYVQGKCLCEGDKRFDSALCSGCSEHLRENQPALLHDIENATGDPLMIAMGEFESLVRRAQ